MCDLDATAVPSIFKIIRSAGTLTRMNSVTFDYYEEINRELNIKHIKDEVEFIIRGKARTKENI